MREERGLRRHLDEIGGWHIEGPFAADAEIRLGRGDQRLGAGDEVAFGARLATGKSIPLPAGFRRRAQLHLVRLSDSPERRKRGRAKSQR